MDKIFAKPFLKSLEGHRDTISCICKHPCQLSILVSGAYDGEVRMWNLALGTCIRSFLAHDGVVRSITYVPDGNRFITLGDDKTIKTWNAAAEEDEPLNTIISKVHNSCIYLKFLYEFYVRCINI